MAVLFGITCYISIAGRINNEIASVIDVSALTEFASCFTITFPGPSRLIAQISNNQQPPNCAAIITF